MSQKEKLIARLTQVPKDFTFDEMKKLLELLGFQISNEGKTSGSRVLFKRGGQVIRFHKPHPQKEFLTFQIKQVILILEKAGLI